MLSLIQEVNGESHSWKRLLSMLHITLTGNFYAVGSNSRNVYICASNSENSENEIKKQDDTDSPREAKIIKTLYKHHKGSVYCLRYVIEKKISILKLSSYILNS